MLPASGVSSVFWQVLARTAAIVAASRWEADCAVVLAGSDVRVGAGATLERLVRGLSWRVFVTRGFAVSLTRRLRVLEWQRVARRARAAPLAQEVCVRLAAVARA